jgi:hypothetical protein
MVTRPANKRAAPASGLMQLVPGQIFQGMRSSIRRFTESQWPECARKMVLKFQSFDRPANFPEYVEKFYSLIRHAFCKNIKALFLLCFIFMAQLLLESTQR